MVQQIVRTSSGAANNYRKQISATSRYKSKTSSFSQTETNFSDVHSRSAPTSIIQNERINALNTVWRDGTKKNIDTYSEAGKNFVAKGTTIQCRLMQI